MKSDKDNPRDLAEALKLLFSPAVVRTVIILSAMTLFLRGLPSFITTLGSFAW
jgi:hypothetical protein